MGNLSISPPKSHVELMLRCVLVRLEVGATQ